MEREQQNETNEQDSSEKSVGYADLLKFLRDNAPAITEAGPKSGDHLISQWRSACASQPSLRLCTPPSVLRELVLANRLDVDFGSKALGEAFMESRRNKKVIDGREMSVQEARLGLMYAGRIKLALRSGAIQDAYAVPVFKGDEITIDLGTTHAVKHRPSLEVTQNIENMIGCYAVVVLPGVGPRVVWLGKDKIRAASEKRTGSGGPWEHEFEAVEMSKKTALNNALKGVPRCGADLHDDDPEPLNGKHEDAKPSQVAQRLLAAAPAEPVVMDLRATAKPEPVYEPVQDAPLAGETIPADLLGQAELTPKRAPRTARAAPDAGGKGTSTAPTPPPAGATVTPSTPGLLRAAKGAARRAGAALTNAQTLELVRAAMSRYGDEERATLELEDADWTKTIEKIAGTTNTTQGGDH